MKLYFEYKVQAQVGHKSMSVVYVVESPSEAIYGFMNTIKDMHNGLLPTVKKLKVHEPVWTADGYLWLEVPPTYNVSLERRGDDGEWVGYADNYLWEPCGDELGAKVKELLDTIDPTDTRLALWINAGRKEQKYDWYLSGTITR